MVACCGPASSAMGSGCCSALAAALKEAPALFLSLSCLFVYELTFLGSLTVTLGCASRVFIQIRVVASLGGGGVPDRASPPHLPSRLSQ